MLDGHPFLLYLIPTMKMNISEDLKDEFPIGMRVVAHPMPNDLFYHSFDGVVIGYHDEFITVRDQDDDCFDCEASQLKFRHDCEH